MYVCARARVYVHIAVYDVYTYGENKFTIEFDWGSDLSGAVARRALLKIETDT